MKAGTELTRECRRGRKAAGDSEAVGGQFADLAAIERAHRDRAHRVAARHCAHDRCRVDLDAKRAGAFGRARGGARVDDAGNLDTGGSERKQRLVGRVAVDEEGRPAADGDAVAAQISERRTGQHDARNVVARKRDQPLDGTGGEYDALDADDPQPLGEAAEERALRGGERLHGAEHAVAVRAEDGSARQAAHRRHTGERSNDALAPGAPARIEQRAASEHHVLLGEQHPQAAAAETVRRREPRGSRPDDQHIRMLMQRLGGCRVLADDRFQAPQTRGATDQRLVDALPGPTRGHEGLVVEPSRQKAAEQIVGGEQIPPQGRPAVLTHRHQPFAQCQRRGETVGLAPGRPHHVDQRAGLLGTGGHDAARPVVLEASADQALSVREQRRGERVSRLTAQRTAVEVKTDGTGGVGQQALGNAARAGAHGEASAGTEGGSCGAPTQ